MSIDEKYQMAVLIGMNTYNQTEGDLEYSLVKALEHYNSLLMQAKTDNKYLSAEKLLDGNCHEDLIQILRPYLHFGTNGWRRVAEKCLDTIRPYLKEHVSTHGEK